MKISYIITTWNRPDVLAKHTEMINRQRNFFNFEVEIIIADDGSTILPKADEIIFFDKYVNTESYDKATPSKARNLGIEAATGDLLIFADDDCLPHKSILREYQKTKRGYCAVGYRSSLGNRITMDIENFDPDKDLEDGRPQLYWQRAKNNNFIWHHFSSGSYAIWREDLGKVRYDEDFVGYGMEDRHFAWLLDKAGIKFEFLYTAIIYHQAGYNRPRSQKDEELQINKKMYYEKIGK